MEPYDFTTEPELVQVNGDSYRVDFEANIYTGQVYVETGNSQHANLKQYIYIDIRGAQFPPLSPQPGESSSFIIDSVTEVVISLYKDGKKKRRHIISVPPKS